MAIIGFDVSKSELVGVRINKRGDMVDTFVVKNTKKHIDQFLDSLDRNITVGCEATGEYHNVLATSCITRNIKFIVLNPIVTKQFVRATVRKRKTDLTDAHVIAKCILQGQGAEASLASFSVAKRMLRTSTHLAQIATSIRNMEIGFSDHWKDEQEMQVELQALSDIIKASVVRVRECGIGHIEKKTKDLLISIPGIGENLAATVIAEIGDIDRFENFKSLVAYAGLDPKIRQSGISLSRNTRLTKRGSPYLRRALFIAASVAQKYDPELKAYYEKKRLSGKRYTEATVANARHVLSRVYAVWKRGTPYVIHN